MEEHFPTHKWRIQDFVDVPTLQRIQDTFAKAMDMAAVTVDRDGVPVTKASNFQPVCRLMRSTPEGLRRCHACDACGGLAAYRSGRPATYVCHAGLVDVAAPIIIEDEYLGCLLCGQVMLEDERERTISNVLDRNHSLGIAPAELEEAVYAMPAADRDRLDSAVEMLMLAASHIIEIGKTNLIQARLLKEVKAKAATEKALQDAQLRALQARVNPHFLFNSLTLIGYTAFEEKAVKTEEVAYMLSDILRYSLRNLATSVPLSEEFDMIERCLRLHQLRFGDHLSIEVDLDESLRNWPVPCMVLQPLAENAIVHGVEALSRPVRVRVSARRVDDRGLIEVYDNGAGMSEAQVAALNNDRCVLQQAERSRAALGLQSVITRLDSEYGNDFDLKVTSRLNEGTRIELSWPLGDYAQLENA
ncbi:MULTISPECIES: sensor histidine kinase [Afifella]|uniref:Histidine kinase-, DNA gyrase B-, and HSP90-like ATPase n=1 Tax=Afifella marina DSM 2698 TaxID=1120955 RepID=A0A1G5NWM4_AFIMA|nr:MULTISPECIES: PocR ligand-binding domain-containing protein [Afifella]MBK1624058.1 hypothetical protein [Afifella marina DSM 2698]MBK1627615.1 hypothetical protein [Afifella marina]MBK5916339.1 hypothetical protein [Afifella marina]MCF1502322.1 PocR ligand-binding domain-containing protein [Afifella sp. H1R]RAI20902.1 hypothetical protein CH311_08170 [Afifella marina DSM 2698]